MFVFGGIQIENSSVNSSPGTIITGFLTSIFAIFMPRKKQIDILDEPVGLMRRYFAFYLDSVVLIIGCVSLGVIPTLIAEYHATGHWNWVYERDEFHLRDIIGIVHILSMFAALWYFFVKHASLEKSTPGQYIMGYRIIRAPKGRPHYHTRNWGGMIALALSFLSLIIYRNVTDGIYPWDKESNTRAITIE